MNTSDPNPKRTTSPKKGSAFWRGHPRNVSDEKPKPPTMVRSRTQVATAYAPGRLFTWEGGRGICLAVPLADPARPNQMQKTMIKEGIDEFIQNWAGRALNCRPFGKPIYIEQCLDSKFLNHSHQVQIDLESSFEFTRPSKMGYVPYPLLFQCTKCGHLKNYHSAEEQASNPLPFRCEDHIARFRQVDVVFVHWSGDLEPLTAANYVYNPDDKRVSEFSRCKCGSDDFFLDSNSTSFGDWSFRCAVCSNTRELKKADKFTYQLLAPKMQAGETHEWIEINMLPVSYRANSVQYVQGGRFIVLENAKSITLLQPGEQEELVSELARIHDIPFKEPTPNAIREALKERDRLDEWEAWEEFSKIAEKTPATAFGREAQKSADGIRGKWFTEGVITRGTVASSQLPSNVNSRGTWARRFDPVRLTVEHDTFFKEHVTTKTVEHTAHDVLVPDRTLSDTVGDPAKEAAYKKQIGGLLSHLGIGQMVLIRDLPICEYTFGFSRVSSGPVYDRQHNARAVPMPVRLMAFPPLIGESGHGRSPIYVLDQQNEAFYVRLEPTKVLDWLTANVVPNLPKASALGAAFLEQYQDFGPYLERFRTREEGSQIRDLCSYIYMLLHSMAHQMVHSIAELSGLDRDALGEHIYPADLAFVLYRRGMTPDLGNISAMWRNQASAFLSHMLDPRMLRCGSGSLCDARGAACPACIMVSDISCIAGNQLVSRAALGGGSLPMWEMSEAERSRMAGYFEVCRT
jgi:hypothetical protein